MNKEDIRSQKDYSLFWHQERKRYDDKEITKEEFNSFLKEAIRITKEQERKAWLETNEDILCNNCGESVICFWHGANMSGLIDCEVYGGFDTPGILHDMTKYKFNLCEKCLKEMFDKFKIPVSSEHDLLIPF